MFLFGVIATPIDQTRQKQQLITEIFRFRVSIYTWLYASGRAARPDSGEMFLTVAPGCQYMQ
jgi:hypothetical protein